MGSFPRLTPVLAACAAALALAGLASCGPSANKGAASISPLTEPEVAATVNGKPIYVDDVLAEAVARGAVKEGEDLDPQSPLFYQITEDLIETRLFAIEAEARGLDKDPEVKHRLDIARERILANVLNENIAATALKESAIERMYREQVKLLKTGQQVRISHILFDSKEAALAAKRRLDQGEMFVALAYELSRDRQSAPDGGDLGFSSLEALPDSIRQVVASTDVGKVGGPVKTAEGWHLIKVDEKRDTAPPSLESMRPKIVQWLMFDEQRRVVEKLKAAARIARLSDQPPSGYGATEETPEPDSEPTEDETPRLGPGAAATSGAAKPAPAKPDASSKPKPPTQAAKPPEDTGLVPAGAAPKPGERDL
jgi:peptidyl-prolyl cis-trans isomerase C